MNRGAGRDDRALVERYRCGDEDAFRVLFARHRSVLQAWLRKRLPGHLGRRVSVADLLQEVQVVAYRRCAEFEPDGPGCFRTWLVGIAELKSREAIRFHDRAAKRAVRREITRGQRVDTGQFVSLQASPSEHAIAHETADRAREALATLASDDREILRLVRQEQLPLREAAVHTGRSYDATRKLYARALVRFKVAFEGLEHPA